MIAAKSPCRDVLFGFWTQGILHIELLRLCHFRSKTSLKKICSNSFNDSTVSDSQVFFFKTQEKTDTNSPRTLFCERCTSLVSFGIHIHCSCPLYFQLAQVANDMNYLRPAVAGWSKEQTKGWAEWKRQRRNSACLNDCDYAIKSWIERFVVTKC